MKEPDYEQLTLFPAGSRASHFLSLGSEEARMMTVTSGRRCSELYRRSGPLGSLVRTLLESSAWHSTRCFLTWKMRDTPQKRLYFQLVPSMPPTAETGLRLLPTPVASDANGTHGGNMHGSLRTYVHMWPTPTARDCKGANSPEHFVNGTGRKHVDQLANRVAIEENFPHGQLNPEWVEWLMGFPIGWTELSA